MTNAQWRSPSRNKGSVRGTEAIAERPDGTRVPFMPYPTPLFDQFGTLTGAVNLLVDITTEHRAEEIKQRLASIVQFSNDAIISKNLNGIIESWNAGAERIYGYTADEAIGQSIEMLIPEDRPGEEPQILAQIRRGERIDHYETKRRHKDGSLIDISLTVSPIIDSYGQIIGASKIARDITDRRKTIEQKDLLLREMNHRIKNLFTLAGSVVALSARSATSADELAGIVRERLEALANAHALTLPKPSNQTTEIERPTTLQTLIRAIVQPFEERSGNRITIEGPDIDVSPNLTTDFALLLHEFATNAAKYGSLSASTGHVDIKCAEADGLFTLTWTERGGPAIDEPPRHEGFGSQLARATITRALGGELNRDWSPDGLTMRLIVQKERLVD